MGKASRRRKNKTTATTCVSQDVVNKNKNTVGVRTTNSLRFKGRNLFKNPTDARDFAILRNIFESGRDCHEYIDRLQPADVDGLAMEIARAFERCSVPEGEVSDDELRVNQVMMGAINDADARLERRATEEKGPMLHLLRCSVVTPQNLKALLNMIDADRRTGTVRCGALRYLHALRPVMEVWKLKLPRDDNDDEDDEADAPFALLFTKALCKFLHDETMQALGEKTIQHLPACPCNKASVSSLLLAFPMVKEKPSRVLRNIAPFDWTAILRRSNHFPTVERKRLEFHCSSGVELFLQLHRLCEEALHKDPTDSEDARVVLAKLGACHDLLCRELCRVVAEGERWADVRGESFLDLVVDTNDFLSRFYTCLVPLPADAGIDCLVKKAHSILQRAAAAIRSEHYYVNTAAENALESLAEDGLTTLWQEALKIGSEEDRWILFCATHPPAGDHVPSKLREKNRLARQELTDCMRRHVQQQLGNRGEMCAGCYVLEKDIRHELLECARCKLVQYCSRECQQAHWKRAHKEQCLKCR